MKNSMYKVMAALACAAILAACGGGSSDNSTVTTPLPPQPAFTIIEDAQSPGSGTTVSKAEDLVTVHYTGYLYDETKADKKGAKFESSEGGAAAAVTLGYGTSRLLGWDQGLIGMKIGGKRTLLIPATMAFGAGGYVKDGKTLVPANTAVVYEMTMLSITTPVKPPKPTQPTFTKLDTVVGTGTEATDGKTVSVHYTGWLYDSTKSDNKGTQFETSRSGSPFTFKLGAGAVIKGWDQGILGMKVGGKRTLLIPSDMAYGALGSGAIPANTALVFEVELMSVK